MADWKYPHGTRGTCVPGCATYGYCHCMCGRKTGIATPRARRGGVIPGRPMIYVRGHNGFPVRCTSGGWSRRGIPMDRIRPLMVWLKERYGHEGAGRVVGIPQGTWESLHSRKRKRVSPATARAIQQAVLAHRKRRDSLATFDTDPIRVLTTEERDQMLGQVQSENFRWANPGEYYNESVQEEWLRLHDEGWSYSAIARKYKRYHSTVRTAVLNQRAKAA